MDKSWNTENKLFYETKINPSKIIYQIIKPIAIS